MEKEKAMKVLVYKKGLVEPSKVDPQDLKLGNRTLGDILSYVEDLENGVRHLTDLLEHSTIIRKGDVVGVNGTVHKVEDIKVFKDQPKHDLRWYKVENGELVLDKKKVGVIL